MKFVRGMFVVAGLAGLATVAWLGCSKNSSSPAGPGGGGGGGGTTINSPIMAPGATFSFTFNSNGVFGYHCGVHPAIMTGNTVAVSDTSTRDTITVKIVGTSTPGFSPSDISVKKGAVVTWVNVHTVNHSVESD